MSGMMTLTSDGGRKVSSCLGLRVGVGFPRDLADSLTYWLIAAQMDLGEEVVPDY